MSSFRVKCQWVGVALLLLLMGLRTEGANVYWTNPAGGSWTTAANWSTGVVPGTNDHAFIISNGTYAVSLDANASAASVTLGAAIGVQTLNLTANTLTPGAAMTVKDGGSLYLNGGGLKGGVLIATNGIPVTVLSGNLDGVTVNGDLDVGNRNNGAYAYVYNGLVLNGTLRLGNPTNQNYGLLDFSGTQTLSGNGTVLLGTNVCNGMRMGQSASTLTVGPGVTIAGYNGLLGYSGCLGGQASVGLINQGSIVASNGQIQVVAYNGVTNQGTLLASGGSLLFGGPMVNSGLLRFGRGFLDVNGSFAQTSSGVLGMEIGGTAAGSGHGQLRVTGPAALNGELRVTLTNGFLPQIGDQFAVVTAGTRSGMFATVAGDSRFFTPQYGAGHVVLAAQDPVTPVILVHPESQSVPAGSNATFTVLANGTPPLSYHWFFNTTNLLEATGPMLTITNISILNVGNYRVVVSNAQGMATSTSASLMLGCVPPPAGLAAWWRAEGNALDTLGASHGTFQGSTSYMQGRIGQAFHFTGANRVRVPDGSATRMGTNSFTFQFWVKPDALLGTVPAEGIRLLEKTTYPGTYFVVDFYPTGRVEMEMRDSSTNTAWGISDGRVELGIWNHVAIVVDRDQRQIRHYLNGIFDSQSMLPSTFTNSLDVPNVAMDIGSSFNPFRGDVDEFAIYKRALTGGEIASIYAAGSAGMCTSSAPAIVVQPVSQSVAAGADVTLNIVAGGLPAPQYQWFYNGSAIGGATSSSLALLSVDGSRSGAYHVVVSNALGSVSSAVAMLMVLEAPAITQQPLSETALSGQAVSFTAEASGALPLGFFWYRNGVPLTNMVLNGHSSTISLANVQTFDSANFQVIVTNAVQPAGVASAIATLTVVAPVAVSQQPTNVAAAVGGSATVCVTATGSAPIRYQWRHNGANIPNATNACLIINNVSLGDGGAYQVVLENAAGTLASDTALLVIAAPAAPAPDQFTNRFALTGASGSIGVTNVGATKEPLEPDHAGKPGAASVWYRWTAPATGIATFRTLGSTFDTLLAIYTGTNVTLLTPVASDEDDGGFFTSLVAFNAVQGTEYEIALDGFGGAQGNLILS